MANHLPFPDLTSGVQIGTIFVQQYYYTLENRPFLLHQLYTNSSIALRIDRGSVHTANAASAIQELITSSNYTAVRVSTAHSTLSWQNRLLVMVSGSTHLDSVGGRRNFVQTFVLALQEPGYFVLYDMLYFFNEEDEAIRHFLIQKNFGFGIDDFATFSQPASAPAEFNGQTQEISAEAHADQGGLPASNQSPSSPLHDVEGSAQVEVSASEHNDQQIGTIFVQQYYYTLENHPFLLHQLYTNSSIALRIDRGSVHTANAASAIQELITSSNYTAVRVSTAHSMLSWQNCLLVMVSGTAQIDSVGSRRKFVQTFVLVLQEPGYLVLYDVLYFFNNEDEAIQHIDVQNDFGFGIDGFASFPQPASVPAEFNSQTQENSAQTHADQGSLPASNRSPSSPLNEVEGSAQVEVSASEQNDQQVSNPSTNNGHPASNRSPFTPPSSSEQSDKDSSDCSSLFSQ